MDLSKFKKISQGKGEAVLKHVDGHELKIAYGNLSKKLQKQFDALPVHAAEGMLVDEEAGPSREEMEASKLKKQLSGFNPNARAGEKELTDEEIRAEAESRIASRDEAAAKDEMHAAEELKQRNKMMASYGATPDQLAKEPSGVVPEAPAEEAPYSSGLAHEAAQDTVGDTEAPVKAVSSIAPKKKAARSIAEAMPAETAMAPAAPATPEQQKEIEKSKIQADLDKVQADLMDRQITPKTYSDLFAEKSTLGKIGTLFGLLISGAGSGLAGQENMVMKMMNQEIERDVAAQEKNLASKQSLYTINLNRLRNEADIENLRKQGKLTDAQAKMMDLQFRQQARMFSLMQGRLMTLHSLVDQTQKMPPGPARDAAEARLAMLGEAVQGENYNLADQAAVAGMRAKLLFGQPGEGQGGGDFQKQISGMQMLGPEGKARAEYLQERHIPGLPGTAELPIPEAERKTLTAMNTLDYKVKDLLDFSKKYRGSMNPARWKEGEQKAEELINFYNNSLGAGGGLTAHRLEWLDKQIKKNPTNILSEVMGNNAALREIQSSNLERRNILLSQFGHPAAKGKVASQNQADTIERVDPKSGKIVIYDAKTKKPLRYK